MYDPALNIWGWEMMTGEWISAKIEGFRHLDQSQKET